MKELTKISKFKVNEEYLGIVPRPTKEEYKSLRDSIDVEGQKDPIVVNSQLTILDGHTRHEILCNLGREIEYRIKDFDSIEDERYYVVETNLNRRQLNTFQKIELSRILYEDIRKQLKERVKKFANRGDPEGKHLTWRKILSKQIGVGENQCQQAMALIKHNDFELLCNLREGKISIEQAYMGIRTEKTAKQIIADKYAKRKIRCPMCSHVGQRKEFTRV